MSCIHFLISALIGTFEEAISASTAKQLHNSLYRSCLGLNCQASELTGISVWIRFTSFLHLFI
ncbi:hypothetical protein MKW94_019123, partial [Papaver nudicaule]|nr:hypothetical protein [Papaver nudicaule]